MIGLPMGKIAELKKFYKNQSKNACLKIWRTSNANQIILIRHAKPKISPGSFVTFEEAERQLENYRSSSVYPDFVSPVCSENITDVSVYHSDLNRARETAKRLFLPEIFTLIEDKRFRELDRQNIRLPFKTPYKFHTILSRIAWLTGTMKKVEIPKDAWKRLKENAIYLDSLAQEERTLIVVANGFHNFFVGKFLKRLGYTKVYHGGHKHLSVNIWARSD
ncbi:hypothetical protein E0K83_01590 [Gramella sp. BOM4]|nr:hypothetical protein [Christiangramia bathymodioli]